MVDEGRYRLAAVRDARERDQRGEQHNLASAVGDARDARGRLDAARARTLAARDALTKADAARDALVAGGATSARIIGAEQFVARRRHELAGAVGEELRLEAALDSKQAGVDVARRALARARADREVIDRHFARWRDAQRKRAERRED